MIRILGFVVARESELIKREEYFYNEGYNEGKITVMLQNKRISPRTGLPVRKYNKSK
jgi:hypothetical protein